MQAKLLRHLQETSVYIHNNAHLIPNYGEKYRYGETITTALVESTVNEVVAKRMVKKQQMQWSPEGAHYLLQTRTAVLNDELRDQFHQCYPSMKVETEPTEAEEELLMVAQFFIWLCPMKFYALPYLESIKKPGVKVK